MSRLLRTDQAVPSFFRAFPLQYGLSNLAFASVLGMIFC